MLHILRNVYEVIQNTIGLLEFKIKGLKINHKFKDSNIVYINYFDSHVWGKWVFINPDTDDKIIFRHEYGHRIQSYIIGPLYVFVIYIPSYIHYKIFNLSGKDWSEYYNFYTERLADLLSRKISIKGR